MVSRCGSVYSIMLQAGEHMLISKASDAKQTAILVRSDKFKIVLPDMSAGRSGCNHMYMDSVMCIKFSSNRSEVTV